MIDEPHRFDGVRGGDRTIVDCDKVVAVGRFTSRGKVGRTAEDDGLGIIKIHNDKLVMNRLTRSAAIFRLKWLRHLFFQIGKRHENAARFRRGVRLRHGGAS